MKQIKNFNFFSKFANKKWKKRESSNSNRNKNKQDPLKTFRFLRWKKTDPGSWRCHGDEEQLAYLQFSLNLSQFSPRQNLYVRWNLLPGPRLTSAQLNVPGDELVATLPGEKNQLATTNYHFARYNQSKVTLIQCQSKPEPELGWAPGETYKGGAQAPPPEPLTPSNRGVAGPGGNQRVSVSTQFLPSPWCPRWVCGAAPAEDPFPGVNRPPTRYPHPCLWSPQGPQ